MLTYCDKGKIGQLGPSRTRACFPPLRRGRKGQARTPFGGGCAHVHLITEYETKEKWPQELSDGFYRQAVINAAERLYGKREDGLG